MKPVDPIAEDLALANEILDSLPGNLPNSKKPPRNPQNTTMEPAKHSGEPGKQPKKKHANPSGESKPVGQRKPQEQRKPHDQRKQSDQRKPDGKLKPVSENKPKDKPKDKSKKQHLNAEQRHDPQRPSINPAASPAVTLAAPHTANPTSNPMPKATPNFTAQPSAQTTAQTTAQTDLTPAVTNHENAAAIATVEPVVDAVAANTLQVDVANVALNTTDNSPVIHAQAMPSSIATPKSNPMPTIEAVTESVIESVTESVIEPVSEHAAESEDHATIASAVEHSESLAIESQPATPENNFALLGLQEDIVRALTTAGYLNPTDIQAATIPALLEGRDVLGQAQTGTGKTAAFALPLLSRINVEIPETQVLVLAPTRELAIQVSESFLKYGQHLRGLRVAPIYGGSGYADQIHALRRGAHVVVGTPGRVMDHMRESRLRIDTLSALVLDEADEMLRMGFVDDVQWILDQSPENRQIALFSATMPEPIRQIANKHLKNPKVVTIASKQRTGDNIEQRFLVVDPKLKLEALTRVIEAEEFDGMIIFVKTKIGTVEVADYLREHGYQAVALNGDIAQAQRERTIEQLKEGVFNILVATDVAARGLDVQRITHVINFDLPPDAEAYVHRIGRTGRAGRRGQAIVFVAPKQRGFLREIDRAAGDSIEPMAIPNAKDINAARVEKFKERMNQAASKGTENPELFSLFEKLIGQCVQEQGLDPLKIATGLAVLAQGDRNFYVHELPERLLNGRNGRDDRFRDDRSRDDRSRRSNFSDRGERSDRGGFSGGERGDPLETFRVEVGRIHGVKPGNIVGAIANEIGLDPSNIGQIRIENDYSTVDLPAGMPRELFKTLGRAWVLGRQLRISKLKDHPNFRDSSPERSFRPRKPGGFARSESGRGESGRDESSKGDFSRTNRPPNRSSKRK